MLNAWKPAGEGPHRPGPVWGTSSMPEKASADQLQRQVMSEAAGHAAVHAALTCPGRTRDELATTKLA